MRFSFCIDYCGVKTKGFWYNLIKKKYQFPSTCCIKFKCVPIWKSDVTLAYCFLESRYPTDLTCLRNNILNTEHKTLAEIL